MCAIYAIQKPTYQPAMRIITAITNANPAVVTTSFAHNYVSLTIVRLDIPRGFGMQQANQLTGTIIVLSPTTFSISIDSTQFDAFAVPGGANQQAQVVPIGEDNSILTAATVNVLPYG